MHIKIAVDLHGAEIHNIQTYKKQFDKHKDKMDKWNNTIYILHLIILFNIINWQWEAFLQELYTML